MAARKGFLIVQLDMNARPPSGRDGRWGVLDPVNADGYYATLGLAQDVADGLAGLRPDLDTLVVEVVSRRRAVAPSTQIAGPSPQPAPQRPAPQTGEFREGGSGLISFADLLKRHSAA